MPDVSLYICKPRVLVALIQSTTMATGVVEIATESEEDIHVVINCLAIFYEEGKKWENFRKKNKFHCKIRSHSMQDVQDQWQSFSESREVSTLVQVHDPHNLAFD